MRHFLILLFGCVSFFASAQDSTVTIKPATARYFLESRDSLGIVKKENVFLESAVHDVLKALVLSDSVNMKYRNDSITYAQEHLTCQEEVKFFKGKSTRLEKKGRRATAGHVVLETALLVIITLILI